MVNIVVAFVLTIKSSIKKGLCFCHFSLKLIKMRAELANHNHCAVPFLSRAAVNLSCYDSIIYLSEFLILIIYSDTAARLIEVENGNFIEILIEVENGNFIEILIEVENGNFIEI